MIGLNYPGINRLDYDFNVEGGVFLCHIESLNDARNARWLGKVLHLLPVEPRPEGYSPLGEQHLDPKWVARLGQSGHDCFDAIRRRDVAALGQSLNLNDEMLGDAVAARGAPSAAEAGPDGAAAAYQRRYPGGCIRVAAGGICWSPPPEPVPGALQVNIRIATA